MNFLILGLGSMGKRRIRCLKSLGYENIIGFDMRHDRCSEAENLYNIKTQNNFNKLNLDDFDAFIISTPPDKHLEYILLAIDKCKPAFVEASALLKGLNEANISAKKNDVLIAPSCTLRFHPAIKKIKNIVESNEYGKPTNFSYHSGQYLPDWHPWEDVKDFYVSQKEISACREIVPFELTWIADILGPVKNAFAFYGKTMDVGADIDDTYAITMEFLNCFGIMIVDVVSRCAVRELILNMEYAQIKWNWSNSHLDIYSVEGNNWEKMAFSKGDAAKGYNPNIVESMYIEEIENFINAINKKQLWPNPLSDDIATLKTLHKLEGIS
jgi:predicted dehydrogenase